MLQAEIFIDTRRKAKKGYPIKLQIYCTLSQQRKYIHTKLYQSSKTKKTPEAQEALSKLLMRLEPLKELPLNEAFPLLQEEGDLEILAMKQKLEKHIAFVDFYNFTEKLIGEKEIMNMDTKAFKDAIREAKNFMGDKPFGLNDITYNWAKSFQLRKMKKGTGPGGISYYLRTIRTIHNEAIKRDIGIKDTKPFKGLITNTTSAEHEQKQWSIEDVKNLQKFEHSRATDTTKGNMQRTIDMFMFQIAIGGHDLIDVANLKWSNIKDNRIIFKRYKNRNKPNGGRTVNNMLNQFAQETIERHGDKNSNSVFSFLGDPSKEEYTHRNTAATLKRISDEIGIEPHFSTKSPRYIFRSVAGELLVHDIIIESILGHKPTSTSRKYQKGISHELQDKEHDRIWWELYYNSEPFF